MSLFSPKKISSTCTRTDLVFLIGTADNLQAPCGGSYFCSLYHKSHTPQILRDHEIPDADYWKLSEERVNILIIF